jgi:DNA polymerase III epsilon subunit-like protein
MLVCGIDFEATDKEPKTARITEIGAQIFDVADGAWRPVDEGFNCLVYAPDYPSQSEEVLRVTGITDELLKSEGVTPADAIRSLITYAGQAAYLIAYNKEYDQVLLDEEMKRTGVAPRVAADRWLCALRDVEYPEHYKCRKLSHLALDHGMPIDPAGLHRAVEDVRLMGKLLEFGKYRFEDVLAYSQIPWVYVKANVSFADKDLAKARRYSWEQVGERKFFKTWVKKIKQTQLEKERAEAPFPVIQLEVESAKT